MRQAQALDNTLLYWLGVCASPPYRYAEVHVELIAFEQPLTWHTPGLDIDPSF